MTGTVPQVLAANDGSDDVINQQYNEYLNNTNKDDSLPGLGTNAIAGVCTDSYRASRSCDVR